MNPDALSRRTSRTTLALLAMVSCAALAAPAAAQWGAGYNAPRLEAPDEEDAEAVVPPQRIMRWVARQGFAEVTHPRLNGSTYIVDGIGDDGTRMRFTIDAYDGELISSRPVGRVADVDPGPGLRPPGLIPRGGPPEFGEAPLPPGVVPRRSAPEYGSAEPLAPRGGPPEYGETAPRVRPPVAGGSPPPAAPRQAMRDEPAATKPPGGVYGVNPGSVEGAPKPAAKPAARPPRAASAAPAAGAAAAPGPAAPAAPAPSVAAAPPAASGPKPEATATAPRGPVRVIEGVTPVLPKSEGAAEVRTPEPPPVPPPTALQ